MSRKNISLSDAIMERARGLIEQRACSGLSNLLEVLIREEWERRYPHSPPPNSLQESGGHSPQPPATPVNYRKRRKP